MVAVLCVDSSRPLYELSAVDADGTFMERACISGSFSPTSDSFAYKE